MVWVTVLPNEFQQGGSALEVSIRNHRALFLCLGNWDYGQGACRWVVDGVDFQEVARRGPCCTHSRSAASGAEVVEQIERDRAGMFVTCRWECRDKRQ